MRLHWNALLLSLSATFNLAQSSPGLPRADPSHDGVLHTRSYFHVGGRTINVSTPSYGTGPVYAEQIYVERLTPAKVLHPTPIILWTGLGQTGASWLNTPDGRPGWATLFLNAGYVVYITDQPNRGRSPLLPPPFNDTTVSQGVVTGPYVSKFWTATQSFPDQLWPQASLHTQWPGTGQADDATFEAFLAAQVPSLLNQTTSEVLSRSAGAALLDRLATPAVILTHSQGGPHGWAMADARPDLVKAIIAVEPQGPPFVNQVIVSSGPGVVRPWGLTQTPIAYDPPVTDPAELLVGNRTVQPDRAGRSECVLQAKPARQLANLKDVPVLLLTSEAGYHAVYDWCTVAYLQDAGVDVTWLDLPEEGIKGNSHFMFLEKNNEEIWGQVDGWLSGLGM